MGSWIPITPAKQQSAEEQLLGGNWQEIHLVQEEANAGVYETPMKPDKWNMSFSNLLALAHAAGSMGAVNASGQTDFVAAGSSWASQIYPPRESSQLKLSREYSSIGNNEIEPELNSIQSILPSGETSTSSRMFFDLNLSPVMTTDESLRDNISSHFEPTTPQKNPESITSDCNTREKFEQLVEVEIFEEDELRKKVESELVKRELLATASTQQEKNHKLDKGVNETSTWIQTPPPKTRKMHRSKVRVQSQPQNTQKFNAKRPPLPYKDTKNRTKAARRKIVYERIAISQDGEITDSRKTTISSKPIHSKPRRKRHRPKVIPEVQRRHSTETCEKTSKGLKRNTKNRWKSASRKITDNQIIIHSEGESSRTDSINFSPSWEKPEGTRIRSLKSIAPLTGSCRRALNFDMEIQVRDPSSLCCQSVNGDTEMQPENIVTLDELRKHRPFRKEIKKFADEAYEKEVGTHQETDNWTPNRSCLTQEKRLTGLKRTLREYDSGGVLFPSIFEKKRTEKGHGCSREDPKLDMATVSDKNMKHENLTSTDCHKNLFSVRTNRGFSECMQGSRNLVNSFPVRNRIRNGVKKFQSKFAIEPIEWIKKKRSNNHSRMRNIATLVRNCREAQKLSIVKAQMFKIDNRKTLNINSCVEALIADICMEMIRKKRSRRGMFNNATVEKLQDHEFVSGSTGQPPGIAWERMSPIDSTIKKLSQLDINAKSNPTSGQKLNEFSIRQIQNKVSNSLVPYERNGDIVPFESLFDGARRKQQRPKVDVDNETTRVWKLLLENINDEGIDGTDEGNRKKWTDDRKVFNERADLFIARMRLIQGDRRFSPWKGSVVDSVVGVFLTQNVSDHLSSSAFMSLAACFPLKPKGNDTELCENGVNSEVQKPEICMQGHKDTITFNKILFNKPDNGKNTRNSLEVDCCDVDSFKSVVIDSKNFIHFPVLSTDKQTRTDLPSLSEVGPTFAGKCSGLRGESDDGSDSKVLNEDQHVESQMVINNLRNEDMFMSPAKANTSCMEEASSAECFDLYQNDNFTARTSRTELRTNELRRLSDSTVHRDFKNQSLYSLNDNSGINYHEEIERNKMTNETESKVPENSQFQENKCEILVSSNITVQNIMNLSVSESNIDDPLSPKVRFPDTNANHSDEPISKPKGKKARMGRKKNPPTDWNHFRNQACGGGDVRTRNAYTMDSVDWDAVRCADAKDIANIIKERGMNNVLAQRIKDFLNLLVRDHGSTDLEWLRDIPADKAKEYLLSIKGLGLKSVECVRLLTLHQLAFPVDTNVGRIAVRLGWVPLQPLPETLQLHLLELYPVLESIQKYLWPRLCKLDQRTLYELHYQMITFGKVFCTKNKPNCNACPMKAECRHFASAFASARLALMGTEERSTVSTINNDTTYLKTMTAVNTFLLLSHESEQRDTIVVSDFQPIIEEPITPEHFIEEPETLEPGYLEVPGCDDLNSFGEDCSEIPIIKLNMEEFTQNLQIVIQQSREVINKDISKALIALNSEDATIPVPKLKNVSRLRTEHHVYELPDSHTLLEGIDKRETDDSSPYLLAIWGPGETQNSTEPPERRCNFQDSTILCSDETCLSCNSIRESHSQTVRGTLLIPCRTAMRGSFPLNGTYFQVNEVFSDHETSLSPMDVPRELLWNMRRRTVYFGTSIPTIFRGLSTEAIQHCFWRGFVCVRGFDRRTRAPRPLVARLHFPASKLVASRAKEKRNKTYNHGKLEDD